MTNTSDGVRIGPSSLVTLIAALLLAVLAMLCATSANAQFAMAQRQADATTQTYAVDAAGQRMVAGISDAMANGSTSAASLAGKLDAIANDALAQSDAGLEISAHANSAYVTFTVQSDEGRTLNATVLLNGGHASIGEWKTSTTQPENEETLWSSNGNQ